jgi:endonuclease/exonuclease/phosphatase family metal-dependent hydrolase
LARVAGLAFPIVRRGALVAVALALGLGSTLVACSSDGSDAGADKESVRVVTQNLLHGTACPPDSDRCDLPDRVALFTRQLAAADCPQVVGLQETNEQTVAELRKAVPKICDDRYRIVWDDDAAADREVVLTTLPVLGQERVRLAGPLRTALWVRVKAPVGPVDVVATHLASGDDDRPCDSTSCRPPCQASDTLRTCQAREAADLLDSRANSRSVGILTGDLNAQPDSALIAVLHDRGYVDASVAAKIPECDKTSGVGCTSGRIDDALTDMKDPSSKQTKRIDYFFLATKRKCTVGTPTGVFAPEGGPTESDGIVFPSDHSAVEATITCATTSADVAAAKKVAATTTTTGGSGSVPAATQEAVRRAFDTVFSNREPDPAARLRALEHGAAFEPSFRARLQQVGNLNTSVRIDSMQPDGSEAVSLVYSILVDGNVVLDALPGRAVKVDDTWLVSSATYCQVATLGTTEIPEPCR